jgi:hypothetical protein
MAKNRHNRITHSDSPAAREKTSRRPPARSMPVRKKPPPSEAETLPPPSPEAVNNSQMHPKGRRRPAATVDEVVADLKNDPRHEED